MQVNACTLIIFGAWRALGMSFMLHPRKPLPKRHERIHDADHDDDDNRNVRRVELDPRSDRV